MISSEEAESLISKLVLEEIPVCARFFAKEGPSVALNGSLERMPEGLMIWGDDEDKHPERISYLLLTTENCEFSFQDKRETPIQFDPERTAAKYGNATLLIRYPSGSFATIFFNL